MLAIAPDDDDGNAASGRPQQQAVQTTQGPTRRENESSGGHYSSAPTTVEDPQGSTRGAPSPAPTERGWKLFVAVARRFGIETIPTNDRSLTHAELNAWVEVLTGKPYAKPSDKDKAREWWEGVIATLYAVGDALKWDARKLQSHGIHLEAIRNSQGPKYETFFAVPGTAWMRYATMLNGDDDDEREETDDDTSSDTVTC
jgi:hypothetical protein